MPERKHNLSFQQGRGRIWVTSGKKGGGREGKKKKSGQEGQNNLCLCFAGHASMGQPQYPLPQLGQQVISMTGPVSSRLIETRLYGLGEAASLHSRKR